MKIVAQDTTFSVKVSQEIKDRVQEMAAASGLGTTKEWFERLLSVYEMELLKEGVPGYEKDINELELHTNRISELVANMIRRSNFEKSKIQEELASLAINKEESLKAKNGEISELQTNIKELEEQLQVATKDQKDAEKLANQYAETNERNRELLGEYKAKIEDLSSRLEHYKTVLEENSELKGLVQNQQEKIKDQQYQVDTLTTTIESMKVQQEKEVDELTNRHLLELERAVERKEREKERELFEVQTKLQSRIEELTVGHAERVQGLYEEMNKLRNQMEVMREQYEQRIEKLTNSKGK